MAPSPELKVLIVAPNASAKLGGEAFLPLKYFQLLKQRDIPCKLIAHSRNRDELLETLEPYLEDVLFIEDTRYHRIVWRMGSLVPGRMMESLRGVALNFINEYFQLQIIKELVKAGKVNIIHQPIPVSPLTPSNMHKAGIPYIIGPMNGGMTYPTGFEYLASRRQQKLVNITRKLAQFVNRLVPGKFRANTLLVANQRTNKAISFLKHSNVIELVENGVDLGIWQETQTVKKQKSSQFRLVFMGRLVGWKAIDFTLRAVKIAVDSGNDIQLDILGDGEERANLEALVQELGLEENINFHGFLPQNVCAEILQRSDALILNSVWECGGAVVLEAMSMGLPTIVSDWGGPADYVDSSCGILVNPVPKEGFSQRLSEAIIRLARDPELKIEMGEAAMQRVRDHFDWDKKIDLILEFYNDAFLGIINNGCNNSDEKSSV